MKAQLFIITILDKPANCNMYGRLQVCLYCYQVLWNRVTHSMS